MLSSAVILFFLVVVMLSGGGTWLLLCWRIWDWVLKLERGPDRGSGSVIYPIAEYKHSQILWSALQRHGFAFQLWWHYNWSNIFFQRIINSYWSLRRCHVHLSTCHSRDTGAANLWRKHLVFLLSHINMKQTWLKTCGFRLLLRWRAIKISL